MDVPPKSMYFLCPLKNFSPYVGGDERKALDAYMLYGGSLPRLLALSDEKDKKIICHRCTPGTVCKRYC